MKSSLYLPIVVFVLLLLSVNQGVGVISLDENIRLGVQSLWCKNLNNLIIAVTSFGAEFSVFASLVFVVVYFSWEEASYIYQILPNWIVWLYIFIRIDQSNHWSREAHQV